MAPNPEARLVPPVARRPRARMLLVLGVAALAPLTVPAAALASCPALLDAGHGVRIVVGLEQEEGATPSRMDRLAWDALRGALEATPLPAGVTVDVRSDLGTQQPPPATAIVRVRGGVLQVGSLRLLTLNVALDPGDDQPDLSVDVQDRVFTAAMSRDWLQLPATVIDEARLSAIKPASDAARSGSWSPSVAFLRGMIAYLGHRRLPPACVAEAAELETTAITSLRRWDGPRQEDIAAEASAVAKQLRALLEFDDDACSSNDGGEDPVRLLVAAARLAPHRTENRRLAVIAQLHRSFHPDKLCGATLERDLLASVALAPADQGTLRDAGMAYDLLAQGSPHEFVPGQEIDRVAAFKQMRRVPPAYRPAVRGMLEIGLGGLVSVESSKAVAPGGRLELWLGPSVVPLAVRAAAEVTASREIPFAPRGSATWRRDSVSLGLGYRLGGPRLFVDLFVDGAIAAARIDGSAFVENRSTSNLDAGGGGGVRAGWSWGRIALSAELAGQLWAIPQWAEVQGIDERHLLPRGDLSAALMLSVLSGIRVR